VAKMQPGDWLVVGVSSNPEEGVSGPRIFQWTVRGELENIDRLTRVAPTNPVELKTGTRGIVNQAAMEILRDIFPEFDDYEQGELPDVQNPTSMGIIGQGAHEALQWYGWYNTTSLPALAEVVRRNWERAAAYGQTAFGSRVYNPRILDTATYLNRTGQAPIRFMMNLETHRKPMNTEFAKQLYTITGNLTDLGNDMMWIGGISSDSAGFGIGPLLDTENVRERVE